MLMTQQPDQFDTFPLRILAFPTNFSRPATRRLCRSCYVRHHGRVLPWAPAASSPTALTCSQVKEQLWEEVSRYRLPFMEP